MAQSSKNARRSNWRQAADPPVTVDIQIRQKILGTGFQTPYVLRPLASYINASSLSASFFRLPSWEFFWRQFTGKLGASGRTLCVPLNTSGPSFRFAPQDTTGLAQWRVNDGRLVLDSSGLERSKESNPIQPCRLASAVPVEERQKANLAGRPTLDILLSNKYFV